MIVPKKKKALPDGQIMLPGGLILYTHTRDKCVGQNCCIHNPSEHPLKDAPFNWRSDRGLMERVCLHGVGHPDPDDVEYVRRTRGERDAWAQGVHGCDGCCLEGGREKLEERIAELDRKQLEEIAKYYDFTDVGNLDGKEVKLESLPWWEGLESGTIVAVHHYFSNNTAILFKNHEHHWIKIDESGHILIVHPNDYIYSYKIRRGQSNDF